MVKYNFFVELLNGKMFKKVLFYDIHPSKKELDVDLRDVVEEAERCYSAEVLDCFYTEA